MAFLGEPLDLSVNDVEESRQVRKQGPLRHDQSPQK